MKTLVKVLIVTMLLLPAAALMAQESSFEVKRGTVVSVFDDQLVVKMSTGEVRQITVPPGFTFTVDGRQVGLSELTPGTELTAVVKTTKTPEVVKTVSIKNGEVVKTVGNTMWIKQQGQVKAYDIPTGFKVAMDGRQVDATTLRPGTKLTAEIVYTSEKTVTSRDVDIAGSTPPPPPPAAEPAPAMAAAEPAPEPEPAAELPKTASPLPLVALLGSLLTAAGIAIRRRR